MKKLLSTLKVLFLIELRSKELFVSVATSFLLVICLLSVGISASFLDPHTKSKIFPVMFWISAIVSSSISLARAFESDFRAGVFEILLAAKTNLKILFFCRTFVSSLFLFVALALGFFLQSLLLDQDLPKDIFKFLSGSFFISISIAALGNLFSVISVGSSIRSALLPIIFLPCSFPIFFCATESTFLALKQPEFFYSSPWFIFSIFLAAIYSLIGLLLFPIAVKTNSQ